MRGLALSLLLMGAGAGFSGAQELVWTCPVHREVTSTEPGRCDQCGRELEQISIQTAWSCPVHTMVAQPEEGTCPLCGRNLYAISREVVYSCPMHAEVREPEPGSCPICKMDLVSSLQDRPHQDHNPKHGGIFFMAPDSWHHLEGVYPEPGLFRVYFYDNFSQPMSVEGFEARAVLEETYDSATRQIHEDVFYPLVASAAGEYFEARVGDAAFPREITAKVRFADGGSFDRFDFVFADYSSPGETVVAAAPKSDLPTGESPEAIAAAIAERNERLGELVAKGAFTEVYLPALEAKDLALELESRVGSAGASRDAELAWALKELVRAAWLLDDYGDLGNREQVQSAYHRFEEAAAAIASRYGVSR